MKSDSVEAYDLRERVRRYDDDMDIMHPLRSKMISIALESLPFPTTRPLMALDLGVGTGVFSQQLLGKFPSSQVIAIDGADAMLELAKSRIRMHARRVKWVLADFRAIPSALIRPNSYDVVMSAYALHHLNTEEKLAVLKQVVGAIRPGGWFLNADLVVAETAEVERRIQEIRVEAVTHRAPPQDTRFSSADATRAYLAHLEAREQDQPQTLNVDLRILRESGLVTPEVFWKEYREVVMGGPTASTT